MLIQQTREIKALEEQRQLEIYRLQNAMPRRIDVQLHKMHMTNLVETPDIPGLVA